MTETRGVDLVEQLFSSEGMREYLGEPVTLIQHMLQAAMLAEAQGAPDALVAAALLHDVGHVPGVAGDGALDRQADGAGDRHADGGASWLAQWFPASVTEPVRLHVEAKRYLCAVEPDYAGRLSEASAQSLAAQGGPMSAREVEDFFEQSEFAMDAVAVRRWDEAAKDPEAQPPPFEHFRPLLERLARAQSARPRSANESASY